MPLVKHCPVCNRSSNDVEFYGEFCRFCMEDRLKRKIPHNIEINFCKRCGKIKVKGAFVKPNGKRLESVISSAIKGYEINLINYADTSARIEAAEKEGDLVARAEKEIALSYKKTLCEVCYKRASSYYEAVMQLRGSPDRIERFTKKIKAYLESRGAFVARAEEVDNGSDVYVSSKRLAGEFIADNRLAAKISYTLYGLDKRGRRVYRHTYSVRL